MAQWECIVCGLIYDEKEGWPDDGIAPGTKWADVPDDWTCPDCGVGKNDFELIPGTDDEAESEDASASSDTGLAGHPIVVIGSGLAAYSLANAIKKTDADTAITLITRDGGENYSKPMISTGFTKKFEPDQLATQTAENMSDNLITLSHLWRADPFSLPLVRQADDETTDFGQTAGTFGSGVAKHRNLKLE